MPQRGKIRRQEQLIESLLSTDSIAQAAELTGISKSTALRWMKDPEFRQQFGRAKEDRLRVAGAILCRNAAKAALVLEEIISNPATAHESSRVAACRTILELSIDAFLAENLAERLTRLEGQGRDTPIV
jgi:hypothetical protein